MDEVEVAEVGQSAWFDPKGPKAPIAWYGGKYYLAAWIIGHFPDHRVYVVRRPDARAGRCVGSLRAGVFERAVAPVGGR